MRTCKLRWYCGDLWIAINLDGIEIVRAFLKANCVDPRVAEELDKLMAEARSSCVFAICDVSDASAAADVPGLSADKENAEAPAEASDNPSVMLVVDVAVALCEAQSEVAETVVETAAEGVQTDVEEDVPSPAAEAESTPFEDRQRITQELQDDQEKNNRRPQARKK